MYDAAYLALANSLGVPLATLGQRLDAAGRDLSLAGRPHRISEPVAGYMSEPDEASVAVVGAAIAELRTEL